MALYNQIITHEVKKKFQQVLEIERCKLSSLPAVLKARSEGIEVSRIYLVVLILSQ